MCPIGKGILWALGDIESKCPFCISQYLAYLLDKSAQLPKVPTQVPTCPNICPLLPTGISNLHEIQVLFALPSAVNFPRGHEFTELALDGGPRHS